LLQVPSSAVVSQIENQDEGQRLACLAFAGEIGNRPWIAVVQDFEVLRLEIGNGHAGPFVFYQGVHKYDSRIDADRIGDFLRRTDNRKGGPNNDDYRQDYQTLMI
jgi:hypothetical protein